eukprot:gene17773-52316_t
MGMEERWHFFASVVSLVPWKSGREMGSGEASKADMQGIARKYFKEIAATLASMPREMVLTRDALAAMNRRLTRHSRSSLQRGRRGRGVQAARRFVPECVARAAGAADDCVSAAASALPPPQGGRRRWYGVVRLRWPHFRLRLQGEVVVAVRVRPFSAIELRRGDELMQGPQTVLMPPNALKTPRKPTPRSARSGHREHTGPKGADDPAKVFSFDHSYWSLPTHLSANGLATQTVLFNDLGTRVLGYAMQGYNTCIFAHRSRDDPPSARLTSRRASARLGRSDSRGLMVRCCEELWERIAQRPDVEFRVECSYYQIYLERVSCLLNHRKGKALKVSTTRSNHLSSRSHAVFCITVTQTHTSRSDRGTKAPQVSSKVSKMSLVDLAGSERVVKTGATGHGLVEAGNINQSLTTLGKVISTLYEMQTGRAPRGKHVPYRESVLTWLLRESLGGNSHTTMLSTISPSEVDYDDDQAKRIVNRAVVNENHTRRIISQLKGEIRHLELQLSKGVDNSLQEQLAASQKLYDQMSLTWEEKWADTQAILREKELET